MKIDFILNGKDVSVNCPSNARVSSILRENFDLLRVKNGCSNGQCGACSILKNEKIVASCLLPVFTLKNSEIVTEEGFSKFKEKSEIQKAFRKLDIELCDYCKPGRTLAIYAFLKEKIHIKNVTDQEILRALSGNRCNCIDTWSLMDVVKECLAERNKKTNVIKR